MFNYLEQIFSTIQPWLTQQGIPILGIIIFTLLFLKFGHIIIEKAVKKLIKRGRGETKLEEEKRESTLIGVLRITLSIFVVIIAALVVLSEIGVSIGPLLASAGVAGIAIGFGAQYLIKDLINGAFILLENQYREGDVVCFGDTCGLVEDIDLRITTLRDLDGIVHYIPNGEIKIASNLTKQHSNVNLNIGLSYDSDIEKVIEVINKVGNDLAKNPDWKDIIRKPPQFLRIDDFADSAIIFKILGETEPIKQWEVTGELRKRLKIAFDKEGIEIPFPQRDIHTKSKT